MRHRNPGSRGADETNAHKADREFNGAEFVRNGPPGPVLTLLRSMPPTIGLVVGTGEALTQRQTVRV